MRQAPVLVWLTAFALLGACAVGTTRTFDAQPSDSSPLRKEIALRIYTGTAFQPHTAYVQNLSELRRYLLDHCASRFRLGSSHQGETGISHEGGSSETASITEAQFRWLTTAEVGESRWLEPSTYDKEATCAK